MVCTLGSVVSVAWAAAPFGTAAISAKAINAEGKILRLVHKEQLKSIIVFMHRLFLNWY